MLPHFAIPKVLPVDEDVITWDGLEDILAVKALVGKGVAGNVAAAGQEKAYASTTAT